MLQENHDISAFYRGASLKPVFFNANGTAPVDWRQKQWIKVPIKPNSKKYWTYTVPFSAFKLVKNRLMQLAIKPSVEADKGSWEISNIAIVCD